MKGFVIVLMCVAAAILYGIAHDLVTAHLCVEYFTIGHPPVFNTDSPTLLALGWGVIATWWVGLMIGVPLALAARLGARPKLTAASLVRPVGALLLVMGCGALAAGVAGFVLARRGSIFLSEPFTRMLSKDKQVPFIADLWAHSASYLIGFVGGVALIALTWKRRAVKAA